MIMCDIPKKGWEDSAVNEALASPKPELTNHKPQLGIHALTQLSLCLHTDWDRKKYLKK